MAVADVLDKSSVWSCRKAAGLLIPLQQQEIGWPSSWRPFLPGPCVWRRATNYCALLLHSWELEGGNSGEEQRIRAYSQAHFHRRDEMPPVRHMERRGQQQLSSIRDFPEVKARGPHSKRFGDSFLQPNSCRSHSICRSNLRPRKPLSQFRNDSSRHWESPC